jgi:hypothetical protein
MKIELKVTATDGEVTDLTAIVPDFVAWERHSKRKISDLSAGIGMEDLAFLAYSVLKRTGVQVKPFDGWINNIQLIELAEADPKATK